MHVKHHGIDPEEFRRPKYSQCVFCGRSPTTKEDIIPKWMAKGVTALPGARKRLLFSRGGETVELHRGTATHFNHPLKVVCSDCNNGWMSTLQREAKPILVPLMNGGRCNLDEASQATLAAWSVMTTTMGSFGVRQRCSESFLTQLMQSSLPPDNCFVWLAHLEPPDFELGFFGLSWPADLDPADQRHGHLGRAHLDRLGIVVFLNPNPQLVDVALETQYRGMLTPIWPSPRGIAWELSVAILPSPPTVVRAFVEGLVKDLSTPQDQP